MKILTICLMIIFLFSAAAFALGASTVFQGSFGFQLLGGTNQSSLLMADIFYNYNEKWDHEWTFDLQSDFQSIGTAEAVSKHMASVRYGRSINKELYSFSRLDLENDRLREIDLRQGLVVGLGLWIIDTEDDKLLAEIAYGVYSDRLTTEAVEQYYPLQFRGEFNRKLAEGIFINQEVFVTQLYEGTRYIYDIRLENVLSSQWGLAVTANYDLAAYDNGIRQEDTKFLIELIFNFVSSVTR